MGTKFFAKAGAETFGNPFHTVNVNYVDGTVAFESAGGEIPLTHTADLSRASGGVNPPTSCSTSSVPTGKELIISKCSTKTLSTIHFRWLRSLSI